MEGKLPQFNTRVKLPMTSDRLAVYDGKLAYLLYKVLFQQSACRPNTGLLVEMDVLQIKVSGPGAWFSAFNAFHPARSGCTIRVSFRAELPTDRRIYSFIYNLHLTPWVNAVLLWWGWAYSKRENSGYVV